MLPYTKLALKGFQVLDPDHNRVPAPWEACLLIVRFLATRRGRRGAFAVTASLITYDAYLRAGETLAIERQHVIRPTNRKHPKWAVIVCTSTEHKIAKNRERDDTVTVGVGRDAGYSRSSSTSSSQRPL